MINKPSKTRLLKAGDKIRLKVPMFSGWKGIATVTKDQLSHDDTVWFTKDDFPSDSLNSGESCACRHEVSAIKT